MVFAFYGRPNSGSEHAAAWGIFRALKDVANLTIFVQEPHLPAIKEYLAVHPEPHMRFVAVAQVPWGRWAWRLGRPIRKSMWRAQYLGWLRNVRDAARELEAEQHFDVALQASPGTYWLPSTVVDLDTPSVYGPAGGAATSPPRLWRYLGIRGVLGEWLEQAGVQPISRTPWVRRTWRKADVRLVETQHTLDQLPTVLRSDTEILNKAILVTVPPEIPITERRPYLVFPSQLEARKGPRLALRALVHAPGVRLMFLNEGPEEAALRRLADRWGVADRIEFRGKVPREELFRAWSEAAASVHTGLREEGGAALSEAMLVGVPVVMLGHGGARVIAEANTDPDRIAIIDPAGAEETARRIGVAMSRFAAEPSSAVGSYLDQERACAALRDAVRRAAATRRQRSAV